MTLKMKSLGYRVMPILEFFGACLGCTPRKDAETPFFFCQALNWWRDFCFNLLRVLCELQTGGGPLVYG